ncbi:MAG: hypothetical protein H6817_02865 [Phycisphaerales bacterium]|nr:hypothetical protein [Phycisphaerales bacterium]
MKRGLARAVVLLLPCIVAALALPVRAAHVVPMDLPTLSDHAAQVIVGDVVAAESSWAENPRRIETEYTLRNVRYLKGAPVDASDEFTLTLPGGKIGELQERLCCAPQLAVGERWCLFLLESSPTWPIVGLYQGALRIERDAQQIERVIGADGNAVVAIDDAGFVQQEIAHSAHVAPVVRAANNVRIVPRVNAVRRPAMSFADFTAKLQPILDASRIHEFTGPAGRYTPKVFTATTLKSAATGEAPRSATETPTESPLRGATSVKQVPAPAREEVQK